MKVWTAIMALLMLGISFGWADTWVSYGYGYDYDYDYLRSDRVSREHRDAADVDDWIERGNATVTSSPQPGFENGIRLSAWASGDEYEYEFALASAIYFFEIPEEAEYAEIKIRYRGEPERAEFEDYEPIAGRVWIRNLRKEREYRSYEEGDSETLYGDTFVLRARRRSETIKIPTADHVKDGYMEVHIVVDGSGMLDVEYLDVTTYRRRPEIRVIHRYIHEYEWRPWYDYAYAYFYRGPCYYATDYDYYIVWEFPIFEPRYVAIRRSFYRYLIDYRRRYPHFYARRPSDYVRVGVDVDVRVYNQQRVQPSRVRHLVKWTESHQRTRELYEQARHATTTQRVRTTLPEVRSRVRRVIQSQREHPVLVKRPERTVTRQRIVLQRQQGRSSSSLIRRTPSQTSAADRLSLFKRRTQMARPEEPERRVRFSPFSSPFRSDTAIKQRTSMRMTSPSKTIQQRREEIEEEIKRRKSVSRSANTTPRRTVIRQRQQQSTSSSSDDEDEDEKKEEQQTQRQRYLERSKRRK